MNGQYTFSREQFSESANRSLESSTESSSTASSRGRRQPIEDARANAGISSHATHRVRAGGSCRAIDDAAWMPFFRSEVSKGAQGGLDLES